MTRQTRENAATAKGLFAGVALVPATPLQAFAQSSMQDSAMMMVTQETLPELRRRFLEVWAAATESSDTIQLKVGGEELWFSSWITGEALWVSALLADVMAFMIISGLVAWFFNSWARKTFSARYNPEPASRAAILRYLLFRFSLQTLSVIGFVLVNLGLIGLFYEQEMPDTDIQTLIVYYVASVLFCRVILNALLSTNAPAYRLLVSRDHDAFILNRDILIVHGTSSLSVVVCLIMSLLGLDEDAHLFFLIVAFGATAALWSVMAIKNRKTVAGILTGDSGTTEQKNGVGVSTILAQNWYVFFIAYFTIAWGVSVVRMLLEMDAATSMVLAPLALVLGSLGLYGILLLVIDLGMDRFARFRRDLIASKPEEELDNFDWAIEQNWQADLKALCESVAYTIALFFSIVGLLMAWGVDLSMGGSWLAELYDIFILAYISYLVFQVVRITLDKKIAEETADLEEPEPGDEGGGAASASRLATLLPLFRNFLLITISMVGIMMVLTQTGVDIAPLFAGAGVVGLAIGFGAQTLIRDIFSGAFFLLDDAFRKGEYVEVDQVKGTVEKISIRSFQLRHHLGALHTVPFGEIRQLTNYSRDWAMMKLQLRVTYDTDVEKVRKLIKKLGQQLLEHPEMGDKFLQPLKSQGVMAMEDSAMILRVKFMTKPGEQFVVRKLVYLKIQELFAEHGIKFAHREVTVRVAHEGEDMPDMKTIEDKVAGAALPLIDQQADGAPPGLAPDAR